MGYHISKIVEEVEELVDASKQNNSILVLVELSDIVGAIACYLEKNHPTVKIEDVVNMSKMTISSFKEGHRK